MNEIDAVHKRIGDVEVAQGILAAKQAALSEDVAEIKLQVTNHIPHQIEAVQISVDVLTKKYEAVDAVKHFFTNSTQVVLTMAAAVWTIIQIYQFVKNVLH